MIKAIVAVDDKFGIGRNGSIPWPKNKEDLKYFKDQTIGNTVVMGRNTWEDPFFPGPLKDRINTIYSTTIDTLNTPKEFTGAIIRNANDIHKDLLELDDVTAFDIWIIGGASIYEQTWKIVDEIYITKIKGDFKCDTFINPPLEDFKLVSTTISVNSDNEYLVYRRKN